MNEFILAASKGPKALIECDESIPCDPCVHACPVNAIEKDSLVSPPRVLLEKCTGCSLCVGVCPGLAIFVVDLSGDKGKITLPYEFLPVPEKDEIVEVLNSQGRKLGMGKVLRITAGREKTMLVTVEVDKRYTLKVRNIRVLKNE